VIAPDVPQEIEVPVGHVPFLVAHAVGTQGYFCLSSGASSMWVPFGPQATLFDQELGQAMTHFLSPNPDQGWALRATWRDSRDTSAIWAGLAKRLPTTKSITDAPRYGTCRRPGGGWKQRRSPR
jgi:hypothetical protein